jgi:hypothetical protein
VAPDGGAGHADSSSPRHDATTTPPVDAGRASADAGHGVADSGRTIADASPRDAAHDAPHEASQGDATTTPDSGQLDATFLDGGYPDVTYTIGPPPPVDANYPDVFSDGPKINACGVCDRVWVCNGFSDVWVSTSTDSCAYIRDDETLATLYCEDGFDTLNYPAFSEAGVDQTAGTWSGSSAGLTLTYFALGTPMVISCVPPS